MTEKNMDKLCMEYKQPEIIKLLESRIADGTYDLHLPTAKQLADELRVNIKTVNKALAKMAGRGLIIRKRHVGSVVVKNEPDCGNVQMVEVLYEGFTTVFTHPFWGDIWNGMIMELAKHKLFPVLNMLTSDPETGLLKTDNISLMPDTGKIILGITEQRLLNRIKSLNVPFVTACDAIDDPEIPQVYFDMRDAIESAVQYLISLGCRKIAFIGLTASLVNPGHVYKYRCFIRAIQKSYSIDPALIANTRPLAGSGRKAMQNILSRTNCDAVFAAYDHQLPDIYAVLREHGLFHIPVIGCDGLRISGVPEKRLAVVSPRQLCGKAAAEMLVDMLKNNTAPKQLSLASYFSEI